MAALGNVPDLTAVGAAKIDNLRRRRRGFDGVAGAMRAGLLFRSDLGHIHTKDSHIARRERNTAAHKFD